MMFLVKTVRQRFQAPINVTALQALGSYLGLGPEDGRDGSSELLRGNVQLGAFNVQLMASAVACRCWCWRGKAG